MEPMIRRNIRTAGALAHTFRIGEQARVYEVADALVRFAATGLLAGLPAETAGRLHQYAQQQGSRVTSGERALLYRRVLGRGGAPLPPVMGANMGFPALWDALITAALALIAAVEYGSPDQAVAARAAVYHATAELQENLSQSVASSARAHAQEMLRHLRDALGLLRGPQILAHFGARRGIWQLVEIVAASELGAPIAAAPIRALAVAEGDIFAWLATFDAARVPEDAFQRLLGAAEAWLLARASLSSDA